VPTRENVHGETASVPNPSPATLSSTLKGAAAAMEPEEDEDLNKCRDLLASDDGCDPA